MGSENSPKPAVLSAAALALFLLLNNFLSIGILTRIRPGQPMFEWIIGSICGVFAGQVIMIAIWMAVGLGSPARRMMTAGFAGMALFASWFLSISIWGWNIDARMSGQFFTGYQFSLFTPSFIVCISAPLLILRQLLGWRFATADQIGIPNSKSLTIRKIMMATAVVSLSIASAQLAISGGRFANGPTAAWFELGLAGLCLFFASAIVFTPFLFFTMLVRRNWLAFVTSTIFLTVLSGLVSSALQMYRSGGRIDQTDEISIIMITAATASLVSNWFLLILKQSGLQWTRVI